MEIGLCYASAVQWVECMIVCVFEDDICEADSIASLFACAAEDVADVGI